MLRHLLHVLFRLIWEGALRPLVSLTMVIIAVYALVVMTVNSPLGWRLLQDTISEVMEGDARLQFIEFSPLLDHVRLHGVEIDDSLGRELVTLERLSCDIALAPLLWAELRVPSCMGRDGRVLVLHDDDGDMNIERTFSGTWSSQGSSLVQPVFRFDSVSLYNMDVLISVSELDLYFEGVTVESVNFAITSESFDLYGPRARFRSGHARLSESLFNLGNGLPSWQDVNYNLTRMRDPWLAARQLPPVAPEGRWGWVNLPLRQAEIADFHWKDYTFGFTSASMLVDGSQLDVSGALRVISERPKVSDNESSHIWFDGQARYALRPDSEILTWISQGIVSGQPSGEAYFEPLEVDSWGTLNFAAGTATIAGYDLDLLGWPIDEARVTATLSAGRLTLDPASELVMWGGRITAADALFIPSLGRWDGRVCFDDVDAFLFAAPLLSAEGEQVDRAEVPWFDGLLSTSPRHCSDGMSSGGMRLGGSLTLKGLGFDIAATTPEDKAIQPPMLQWSGERLRWMWRQAPEGMPSRHLEVDVFGRLDQRGRWHLEERTSRGQTRPGLRARRGADRAELIGALQGHTMGFLDSRINAIVDDWTPWLASTDVPALFGPWRVEINATAGGDLESPRLPSLSAVARPLPSGRSYLLPKDSAVSVEGGFDQHGFRVDSAEWSSSTGAAEVSGRVDMLVDGDLFDWRDQPSWSFAGDLSNMALERWFGSPLSGAVAANFRARGNYRGISGSANLAARRIAIAGEPLRQLRASVELDPSSFTLHSLNAQVADGSVEAAGRVDLADDNLDFDLRTDSLSLGAFSHLESIGLRGALSTTARIDQSLSDPAVAFQLVVDDFGLEETDFGTLALVGRMFDWVPDSDSAVVEVVGNVLAGARITSSMPVSGEELRVGIELQDFDLSQAFAEAMPGVTRAPISADGELVISLDPANPGLRLLLNLDTFEMEISQTLLQLLEPTQLEWTAAPRAGSDELAHRVEVETLRFGTEEGSLEIAGSLLDFDQLELSAAGVVPLSLLELLPDLIVAAEGAAEVDLVIGGTLTEPLTEGRVTIQPGGRVAPRGLGAALELSDASIEIESDRFVIDPRRPLRGSLMGGGVTLSGEVGHSLLIPTSADLRTMITSLTWRIPDELVITVTGNLRFTADDFEDSSTWTVGGDVEVMEARYYKNFDLFADQLAFGSIGREVSSHSEPLWKAVPAFGAINTDLRIVGRDRFFVESRVATAALNLELQPDLQLTGPFAAMSLVGEVTLLDTSRVAYRGRQFDVERGTLIFDGFRDDDGYPMPRLDTELVASIRPCTRSSRDSLNAPTDGSLRLETRSDLVRLSAYVEGRVPYDLVFTLESQPFYDQRDLLSLILTGCTLDELTAASGASPTLDILFRPVISAVERNVEERFAVDDVEIVPTAEGVVDIFIRDELTERLSWTFNARVGAGVDGGEQSLRAAYRVLDMLVLEAREQNEGRGQVTLDGGIRLRFRLD